jgi:hypothetical protein
MALVLSRNTFLSLRLVNSNENSWPVRAIQKRVKNDNVKNRRDLLQQLLEYEDTKGQNLTILLLKMHVVGLTYTLFPTHPRNCLVSSNNSTEI